MTCNFVAVGIVKVTSFWLVTEEPSHKWQKSSDSTMIKRDYVLFLFSIDYAEILRNWIRSSYKYFKWLMDDDADNIDRFLRKSLLRPVIICNMRDCNNNLTVISSLRNNIRVLTIIKSSTTYCCRIKLASCGCQQENSEQGLS